MTSETRPVCVYTLANLKRNSNRLLIVMCVGIALALYGIYVQTRGQSSPNYMPTLGVAGNWLYQTVGQRLAHPLSSGQNCKGSSMGGNGGRHLRGTLSYFSMKQLIMPITRHSGIYNGFINVAQIVLLHVYARSIKASNAIICLSSAGLLISMICLIGSITSCKLMCISCLGIHHAVIIYLAIGRRCLLKNLPCPDNNGNHNNNNNNNSSMGHSSNNSAISQINRNNSSSSSSSSSNKQQSIRPGAPNGGGAMKGAQQSGPQSGAAAHSSHCNTRLRKPTERRS